MKENKLVNTFNLMFFFFIFVENKTLWHLSLGIYNYIDIAVFPKYFLCAVRNLVDLFWRREVRTVNIGGCECFYKEPDILKEKTKVLCQDLTVIFNELIRKAYKTKTQIRSELWILGENKPIYLFLLIFFSLISSYAVN